MDNTLTNMGQRVFSALVAAATILSMMGIAAFAVPQQAQAAGAGDLVTASLSAVYFVGYDGARYTFPNSNTFNTWYTDFDDVMTISDSAMADISLGGNVVYRAGSHWIKIQSDARTYAVSTDGMIHWVESEDVAVGLAGSDWNTNIHDVADTFFVDYSTGTSLADASLWEGALYMDGSDKMIIWGGEARMLSSAGSSANNFMTEYYLDGADVDASAFGAGSDITGEDCDLVDASQTGCTGVVATGDVEISLSSSTPAGATVPGDANSVKVFEFDVDAGSDDANINIMTFSMDGIGATTDIDNVYLYEGATRLTEARSVNASTRTTTFGSLDLDIEAGETRTLSLRVELASAASAGNEFYFALDSADDITADGDVDGSFPVAGNTFEIATQNSGTVTLTKNGTISNPSLGEQDATIGQFKVAAATEDAMLEELTLKIDNAADHGDFKLWDGSDLIATGDYIGDKLVMFDLSSDPFSIQEGNSNVFKVSADIGGEADDDVKVYLDNSADILAVGGDYGFGMGVTRTTFDGDSCTTSAGDCSFSDVEGGELTFSYTGPNAGDIRTNSQDQVLLEWTLTAAQEVTIKDLDILVYANDEEEASDDDATDGVDDEDSDGADDAGVQDATGDSDGLVNTDGEANVTDIKIVNADTGAVIMGPLELDSIVAAGNDAVQTIDFTDDFGMDAGETLTLQVLVDVDDSITSGTELAAAIDISGFVVEDANGDTLTNATAVVPSSDITGANQEALAASLTAALSSIPGNTTTVQGTNDVHVQSFSLIGGDAGEVNISSILVSIYSHDLTATPYQLGDCASADQCDDHDVDVNDFIESCSIYDVDGNLLDGPNAPSANGNTLTFDDVNWTIEASENERVDVYCDIGNPSDATAAYFAFELTDTSTATELDITAEDDDGTAVTVSDSNGLNGETAPTNVVTVNVAGSLAITQDSSAPSSDFLLTGSSDNHVSTFRITATNEDFEVTRFTLTEEEAEDQTGTADSSAYTNNLSSVTITYPLVDGTTGTATASVTTNEAIFTGLDMYVSDEDPAIIDVYVDVPTSDRTSGGSATSNERIQIGWDADTTNNNHIVANGVGSTTQLTDTDSDGEGTNFSDAVSGKAFVVRETVPTVTLSSSSPSGVGFVPATDMEVLRFNISAHANEDIVWSEMMFNVATTDNATSSWNLCDLTNDGGDDLDIGDFTIYNLSKDGVGTALEASDAEWTVLEAAYAPCNGTPDTAISYAQLELVTYETVPAGETYTYAVHMNTSGASAANDDSVQLTIADDTEIASASYLAADDLGEDDLDATDVTLTLGATSTYEIGDILCMDTADDGCGAADEKMLLVEDGGATIVVVRGYLNTTPDSGDLNDINDDVLRVPSSFVWFDHGSTTLSTVDATVATQGWGAYLVDSLPVTGGAMGF